MKIVLKIQSRVSGDYNVDEDIIENPNNIVPRKGERITFKGTYYDVVNVHYDFDKGHINLTVL